MNAIHVLLADDHPVVRSGIRTLLENSGEIVVVGEANTGEETLSQAATLSPEILILDMELPDIEGTDVAAQIRDRFPGIKVLALSAHDDMFYIKGVLQAGASGYLTKDEAPESILEAIRGISRGESGWISRRISARMASWVQPDKDGKLTLREEEVLRLVVAGKTNQAIAVELSISEKTVEKYMSAIFNKLNVTSRVEAAVFAVHEGLVKPG